MASGPLPQQQHQRERDTKRRQKDAVTVYDDGVLRGPALVGTFLPETLAWYDDWRRSPMAALFIITDWRRLALLAPMVDKHILSPSAAAMSEIRLNEERLGATYADRLRTRIVVAPAEPTGPTAVVSDLGARRKSLADRIASSAPAASAAPAPTEEPAPF